MSQQSGSLFAIFRSKVGFTWNGGPNMCGCVWSPPFRCQFPCPALFSVSFRVAGLLWALFWRKRFVFPFLLTCPLRLVFCFYSSFSFVYLFEDFCRCPSAPVFCAFSHGARVDARSFAQKQRKLQGLKT